MHVDKGTLYSPPRYANKPITNKRSYSIQYLPELTIQLAVFTRTVRASIQAFRTLWNHLFTSIACQCKNLFLFIRYIQFTFSKNFLFFSFLVFYSLVTRDICLLPDKRFKTVLYGTKNWYFVTLSRIPSNSP